MGGEAERRLHFRHGPPPPQGKGDAVSRVWALSPPGTTDWAAFGRRVSGAWSAAWSPPLPQRAALLPKVPVRGAILEPSGRVPPIRSAARLRRGHANPRLGESKAKEAPSPQRRGPRWSQSERGPFASAAGALVIPQRWRPPRLSGGGLGVRKRKRPPRLSGGGLGGPKAKEAPSPQRRGPRWSQSPKGPLASAAGASVVPKPKRPPRLSGGGLGGPKTKEAPSPQRRGPRWSQSEEGPLASAEGASVNPKRKRPPCRSRGGPDGPKTREAPSPQRRGPR